MYVSVSVFLSVCQSVSVCVRQNASSCLDCDAVGQGGLGCLPKKKSTCKRRNYASLMSMWSVTIVSEPTNTR